MDAEAVGKMSGKSSKTSEASTPTVAVELHVPIDVFKLLQDVALASVLDDVATTATGKSRTKSKTPPIPWQE